MGEAFARLGINERAGRAGDVEAEAKFPQVKNVDTIVASSSGNLDKTHSWCCTPIRRGCRLGTALLLLLSVDHDCAAAGRRTNSDNEICETNEFHCRAIIRVHFKYVRVFAHRIQKVNAHSLALSGWNKPILIDK